MVLVVICTGLSNVTSCHPEAVSPVKVASASCWPPLVHRWPTWVPVFCGALVEAQPRDVAIGVRAELHADLDRPACRSR